jgi:type IV secretory pathway TraG/TraD family ATPase VirD4
VIFDLLAGVYVLLAGVILVRRMREILQAVTFPFWLTWKAGKATIDAAMWGRKRLKAMQREKPYGDRKLADRKALTKAGNLEPGGFVVGKVDGRLVFARYEYGCLMFGRPGSGKSLTMAATLNQAGGEHFVVYDPPGALCRRFEADLAAKGYRVIKIALDRPGDGLLYDVCAGLEHAGPDGLDGDLNLLAGLVTASLHDGGPSSEHFAVTSRIFVKGLLGYLYRHEPEKATMYGLARLLLLASESERKRAFDAIRGTGDDSALMAVNMWEEAAASKSGESSGFRSSLTKALEIWTWPRFRKLTEWEGEVDRRFSWDEVFDAAEPQAVFLTGGVLEKENVDSFVRVFFGQGAASLARRFKATGERLARGAKFMIDEGAVLGRCEPIMKAVEEMRKVGVTAFIGYQSMSQVRDIWGKRAGVLLDSCDLVLAGGSKDSEFMDKFCKLAGLTTVTTQSRGGNGTSESEHSKQLMTVGDLFRLNDDEVATMLGSKPAIIKKAFDLHDGGVRF